MTRDHVSMAKQYAADVIAGTIPNCKWVKLAAERFLTDLKRERSDKTFPYRLDEEKGGRVCRFVEHLKHIKGPLAGTNIRLEPWQCFILVNAFGWVWKAGQRKDMRRFRRVYVEVPRGNAKSTLSSCIALYMLAADGEGGAEVYSAATTRSQARITFNDAQHMCRKSPELAKALGIEVNAHNINVLRTASKFEYLSSESGTHDGLNIHMALIDELHAHKTRDIYDVIETGTGKRPQSLLWAITTAGSNRAGICFEVRAYLTKILQGVATDDAVFGAIWTIDDGDLWTSPASWAKANPNWDISVMPDVVGQLAAKAQQMPAATNNFLTKHLNVWVNADVSWMDMRAWDRAGDPSLDIGDFEGEQCWIGLDLASKTDIAAKMRLFRREIDGTTHYYAFGQYYLPEAAVTDGRNSQYSGWEIEGRLRTTPGDVLHFDAIREDLMEDSRRYQVVDIGYDPWQATQLAQQLQSDGATVTEFRNNVQNFSAPMKEIDALIRSGRLHHDGDPVLAWMASNVVCHVDNKDNIYPRKERPENKIDGIVALITALGRCMAEEASMDLSSAIYDPVIF